MIEAVSTIAKRCYKCKELRARDQFCNSKRWGEAGYPYCKSCNSAYSVQWRKNNYERHCRNVRNAYYRDKDKKARATREYHRRHPEVKRLQEQKRRAKRYGCEGAMSRHDWLRVLASWDGKCANCQTRENITLDHIIPFKMGGTHTVDNVQPLCGSCNSSKNAKAYSFLRPVFVGNNGS